MPSRHPAWILAAVGAALLTAAAPEASTVMQLNLAQMVQRADRIYRGTVLSVNAERVVAGGGQLPITVYRLRVDETFRGEFPEVKGVRVAEIRTLGKLQTATRGNLRSAVVLPRMPDLTVGMSYLVMTTRPSAIGLSTTVGLGQGCFRILQVGKEERAINDANNAGLFAGMPAPPAALRSRSAAASAAATALDYPTLADRIRGLLVQ